MIHHPDRVGSDLKEKANDEFNIIHQAYSILSDPDKKAAYDDGSDIFFNRATVSAQWESHLKTVDANHFQMARDNYQGSEKERQDIIREFVRGNGSITHLLNNIPFMRSDDENRITNLIEQLMENGLLPKIKIKKLTNRY